MMRWRCWAVVTMALMAAGLGGCAFGGPVNPSFAVSVDEAEAALDEMAADPVVLDRPVVVIGGWGDPLGLAPSRLARRLRRATGDGRVLPIGLGGVTTFEACRERVLREVAEAFPSDDPAWTAEVDVIGFSMGGLVAQDAAQLVDEADDARPRLRVRRLFCIATPIRGAAWASFPTFGTLTRGMRHDSDFLRALDAARAEATFDACFYVRLDDAVVGEANAAPPGETAWWVPNRFLQQSHTHAYKDPRIVADIARRLRNEPPFTTWPPAPLPEDPQISQMSADSSRGNERQDAKRPSRQEE